MRIDVINLIGLHARIVHGIQHATRRAIAIFTRRSHMVGIGTHTKTGQFSVDFCTARLGVFIFFKHQNTGTFR